MNHYASIQEKLLFDEDAEVTVYLRFDSIKARNQFVKDEPKAVKLTMKDKEFRKLVKSAHERDPDNVVGYNIQKLKYWFPTKCYGATHVLI